VEPRRLTLIRHGSAESPDLWPEDFERPLTKRGLAEVREMARRMLGRREIPDLVLASPAERTWSTALILARALDLDDRQVRCERTLYLGAAEGIWTLVSQQRETARHLLICGHNPGLSDLASRLGHMPRRHELPPAGTVLATWPDLSWDALSPRSALHSDYDDPEKPAPDFG